MDTNRIAGNRCDLSIVIPVYNLEKQIKRCIESIIPQIDKNEIILVDDGSTDKSPDICDAYANKYAFIRVVHKKNGGMSSSRNSGTKAAVGKYIWYVDGDDYIEPDSVKTILNHICTNRDIYVIDHHNIVHDNRNTYALKFSDTLMKGIDCLLMNGAMQAWITIIKADYLKSNKLYFQEGMYHEDFEWCIRAFSLAKEVEHIKKPLYNYICDRAGSIMNTVSTKSPIGYAYTSSTIRKFIDTFKFSNEEIKKISKIVAIGFTFSIERTKGLSKDGWKEVKRFYQSNIDDICYFLDKSTLSHRFLSFFLKINVGMGIKFYYYFKFQK